MTFKQVSAGHGWQWVSNALDLVKRHPVPFLVMGLIVGIIAIIPVIGGLVLLILGPALIAGTSYAAQQASNGRNPEIGNLFRAFQEGDRIGSLIALCIPTIVGAICLGIVFGIFAVGAFAAAGTGLVEQIEANPMVLFTALGASLFILLPIAIIIVLAIYALTFFAIPRTLLERPEAFPNMKESFSASMKNFGAFIVVIVVLFIGVAVLSGIFKLLHLGLVGDVLVGTALYSVLGSTLYFGFRDVFGAAAGAAASHTVPPVPPTSPAPPAPPPMPPPNPPVPPAM